MPDKPLKKKLSRKDILEEEILLETKNYTSRYRNIELRFQLLKSPPHISQRGRAVVKCWAFCVRLRGKPQKTAHRPSFVFAQRTPAHQHLSSPRWFFLPQVTWPQTTPGGETLPCLMTQLAKLCFESSGEILEERAITSRGSQRSLSIFLTHPGPLSSLSSKFVQTISLKPQNIAIIANSTP